MTTTRTAIHRHQVLAGFHAKVALYLTRLVEGASATELQGIWHEGFETYGPSFAEAVDRYTKEK